LQFKTTALGLSRLIRNENTTPPIAIAVTGKWGIGKSSLMNLVKEDLKEHRYYPVTFNAWYHQKQEELLVALLNKISKEAMPPWWHAEGIRIRTKIFVSKLRKILWQCLNQ
jgi:predicted KAP-like P-loop ATPase